MPGVLFVLPDSYVDPENKDYGGTSFPSADIPVLEAKYELFLICIWSNGRGTFMLRGVNSSENYIVARFSFSFTYKYYMLAPLIFYTCLFIFQNIF